MQTVLENAMKNRNLWIHGWVLLCAAAWLLLLLGVGGCQYISEGSPEESYGRITFLDVGQGLAVLLEYEGRFALYDAGPDSAGLVDSLRNRGVDSLDWVLLSHSHRDHLGGMLELLAGSAAGVSQGGAAAGGSRKVPAVYVARLMVGPDTARGFLMDSVLRAARRFNIPVDTIGRGDPIYLGTSPAVGRHDGTAPSSDLESPSAGLRLTCLWPARYMRVGENGASLVMKVDLVVDGIYGGNNRGTYSDFFGGTYGSADGETYGSVRGDVFRGALLTGDLDSLGETRLLEMGVDVSADLLQVGHHGSAHSSTLQFLNRVSPRYAVISAGADNGYGHPAESVLRKLQYVLNVPTEAVFRTDLHGSVSFLMAPGVGIVR